uniref:HMA domain-containing protein n=1 Tax=Oryza rufipogon TaxID=4529 RepID=A0A0E0P8K9_ORYRU
MVFVLCAVWALYSHPLLPIAPPFSFASGGRSTMGILVISADLKCCRCKEKLSKILCSLRDKYGIEKTEYEDKDDRVIVRGNFPTDKLRSVIWCKAGRKLIRDIAVVDVWPTPPPPKKKPETAGGTTPAPALAPLLDHWQ